MSNTTKKRPIIIIDGQNIFIRNYLVNEAVSSRSEPIGGIVGFLKFTNYLLNTFSPSQMFVVWEAGGGNARRKKIYPGYKANRGKVEDFKSLKTGAPSMKNLLKYDEKTKVQQLTLLYQILQTTPICQVFIKDTEGDDVVGYIVKDRLANDPELAGTEKIIVSSDKDFYQLLDIPDVKIFDPAKKILIDDKTVMEKFAISPRNFCLAKAIVGDSSDNIEGIPSAGFKTVAKRFPELLSSTTIDATIDDIMTECQTVISEKKSKATIYKKILQGEPTIRRNWKLMYLNTSTLAASQIEKINYLIDNHEKKMNRLNMIKLVLHHGINISFDFERFASLLNQNLRF